MPLLRFIVYWFRMIRDSVSSVIGSSFTSCDVVRHLSNVISLVLFPSFSLCVKTWPFIFLFALIIMPQNSVFQKRTVVSCRLSNGKHLYIRSLSLSPWPAPTGGNSLVNSFKEYLCIFVMSIAHGKEVLMEVPWFKSWKSVGISFQFCISSFLLGVIWLF